MRDFRFQRVVTLIGAIALFTVAFAANAQAPAPANPDQMNMAKSADTESSPATQAFKTGSAQMMKDMNAPYSGDADKDFVSHMIAHHQGAVSMAEVELKYGKDPAMRKLARGIIKAQDKEIAYMKKWQDKHAGK